MLKLLFLRDENSFASLAPQMLSCNPAVLFEASKCGESPSAYVTTILPPIVIDETAVEKHIVGPRIWKTGLRDEQANQREDF